GGGQGRCIVDAVSQKDGRGVLGLAANDLQLLLGSLAGVDLFDADPVREVTYLGFAVTRNQEDPIKAVFGHQVADERGSFGTWFVAETESRGVASSNQDHALHAAKRRGKLTHHLRLLCGQFLAAGYLDRLAADGSPQALSRPFADLAGFSENQMGLPRCFKDS